MFDAEKWEAILIRQYGQDAINMLEAAKDYAERHPGVLDFYRDLGTYFQFVRRIPTELRAFNSDPLALDLLFMLISHSRFGFDLIIRNRRMFWDIIQSREFKQVWGRQELLDACREQMGLSKSYEARIAALVRFHQYHTLRVLLGDIGNHLEISSIVSELSDLTDVTCECALSLAMEKHAKRWGHAKTGFVVLGMGKLGGRELNYSSDIDLIFVYGKTGSTVGGEDSTDHHEYFKRVGTELIRILDEHHPNGRLYRVDMRLRPEGASGELLLSYAETLNYYYTVGRHWERQAMIKARPIAGSISLGERLLKELQPWIYSTAISYDHVGQARSMRRQIEDRAEDEDLKAGVGGIRDIEFLVQHIQLLYGGTYPDLRNHTTIPTLRLIKQHGLLPEADVDDLIESYNWLRMAEHRLQMFEARQLHEVPTDEEDVQFLAHRCGFEGESASQDFVKHMNELRARVRALANEHYLKGDAEEDALITLILDDQPPESVIDQVLGKIGFKNKQRAAKLLRSMGQESFFILSRARTQRMLLKILPSMLALLESSPEPDQTLFNFTRIVSAVGGKHYFYSQMLEDPELLITIMTFAGWANYLIDRLASFTGLVDDVFEIFDPNEMNLPDVYKEGSEILRGLSDATNSLAYLQARELVRIAIYDLRGYDHLAVCQSLSHLACAIVRLAFEHCAAELASRWGWPEQDGKRVPCTVLGLGKLGSGELSYASDVDVMYVLDGNGICTKKDRDAAEFWTKVATNLSKTLDGIYEVDPRLRPWGDQGQLVISLDALRHYWSQKRDLWERLAMTRVAYVCGDKELGNEATRSILQAATTAELGEDAAQQVISMRKRLEENVKGRDHLKRGRGGYVDVEFVSQYLSLRCLRGQLPPGLSIRACLDHLAEAKCLNKEDAENLKEALRILRGIEARMRLSAGRAISSIPTQADERLALARRCGYKDVETLDNRVQWARDIARPLFNKLVV